jgi:hypothetical protein
MMASIVFAVVVASMTPSPTPTPLEKSVSPKYFRPPKDWTKMDLPPNAPVDFDWLSPQYRGTGENIAIFVSSVPKGTTLDSVVREATAEALDQARSIASSKPQTTCRGMQAGWTLDVRIPIGPSRSISQLQHVALKDDRLYTIMYTHTAGAPISKAVLDSMDSLCPSNP